MKRRGFTWIELMVALSAVLILSAILFPVFARSEEQEDTRKACQQNLRQVSLAIKQYLSDYDEFFPLDKVGANPYGWADAVLPYVRNAQLFQCPEEPTRLPARILRGSEANYTDYFYNARLSHRYESDLTYIASTILLGEATPGNARHNSTGGMAKTPGIAELVDRNGVPVGAATRHLNGANYAFADGHIKWLKGLDANTCPAIQNAAAGASPLAPTFAIK